MVARALRVLSLACALALVSAGCGGNGSSRADANSIDFDRGAMLANVGENIILPIYSQLDSGADSLSSATAAYCAALGTAGEADALAAARSAWRETMVAWQTAEGMLFGPAAMDDSTLRDQIYSWPVVSSCAVDQDVMIKRGDPAYDIGARLVNRRGLDALEYLLFNESLDHTCQPQNAPQGWDDLPEADKKAARCAFAGDAASDLAARAQSAIDAWDPQSGNFQGDFAGAGQSGSSFESAQAALNVVSDAMFHLDSQVKDLKLGKPAGIVMNGCTEPQSACLIELESQHAGHSRENIAANLAGFEMLYSGANGLGFEDFLRAAGADQLADTMKADLSAAIAAADAIPSPMADALTTDYDKIAAAHGAVKKVTDNLKSQFLTVLGLDIPDDAAADND